MEFYRRNSSVSGQTNLTAFDPVADPQAVDLTRPTLFFFPGILTVDKALFHHRLIGHPDIKTFTQTSEDSLNCKSEVIERIIGAPGMYEEEGIRFFGITYSQSGLLTAITRWMNLKTGKFGDLWNHAAFLNEFVSPDAASFVDTLLWPALTDETGALKPDYRARLSHITFFGDSYGSSFAHQVGNALCRKFKEAGLTERETAAALREIVFVGASNVVRSREIHFPFSSVCFQADKDSLIHAANELNKSYFSGLKFSGLTALLGLIRSEETDHHLVLDLRNRDSTGELGGNSTGAFEEENRAQGIIPHPLEKYLPDTESSLMKFEATTPSSVKITIRPQQDYRVALRAGDALHHRHYSNHERHQSYCYSYPFADGTHARDHSDLLARVLRNALTRNVLNTELSSTPALLSRETFPLADSTHAAEAAQANRHLNQILTPHLGKLEKGMKNLRVAQTNHDAESLSRLETRHHPRVTSLESDEANGRRIA